MPKNSTFHGAEPTWANACVGNNGNPSYVDYAKGYSESANLLIDEVIRDKSRKHSVDTFIYPICFNMRHSLELWLKGTVEVLQTLAEIKGKKLDFDLKGSHDIGNIWGFITSNAASLDKRYSSYFKRLDHYIKDIADVDATGQTFRYPIDNESKKHLTDISIINIIVLKNTFNELEIILDELNSFNDFIQDEYSQCSFTENISRADLFCLANDLPSRSTWAEIDFKSIKSMLMVKYGVSSNELCKGIKIIESNYEMGRLISALPELLGLNFDDLQLFFEQWIKLHGIDRFTKKPDTSNHHFTVGIPTYEEMIKDNKIEIECCDFLSNSLRFEALSGLKALYYFCNFRMFSEHYIRSYKIDLPAESPNPIEYRESINHLLNKTDAFDQILKSLFFLGYSEYAEEIIMQYSLEGCFDWFDRVKSRELFLKPDFFGYKVQ